MSGKTKWLVLFPLFLVVALFFKFQADQREVEYQQQPLLPCIFDPRTDEPSTTPCQSGDKVYR